MKFEKFTLLDYGDYYKAVKDCSVTGKQYQVKITKDEFIHYYKASGKDVKHLKCSNEEKLFLETTLTPEEIKLLTPSQKKVRKSLWKLQIKKDSDGSNVM